MFKTDINFSVLNPSLETLYMKVGQSKLAVSAMDKTYPRVQRSRGHFLFATHPTMCIISELSASWGPLQSTFACSPRSHVCWRAFAHSICNVNRRKLLVFCDWPITQWECRNGFVHARIQGSLNEGLRCCLSRIFFCRNLADVRYWKRQILFDRYLAVGSAIQYFHKH